MSCKYTHTGTHTHSHGGTLLGDNLSRLESTTNAALIARNRHTFQDSNTMHSRQVPSLFFTFYLALSLSLSVFLCHSMTGNKVKANLAFACPFIGEQPWEGAVWVNAELLMRTCWPNRYNRCCRISLIKRSWWFKRNACVFFY